MLSIFINSNVPKIAMPLAKQLYEHRLMFLVPLVLSSNPILFVQNQIGTKLFHNVLNPVHVPLLICEQQNPFNHIQLKDATNRHRGVNLCVQ